MQVHQSSAVFVGRSGHLSHLTADRRRTGEEGARAVLVCGGAGVGKTRLVDEYLRRAPDTPFSVGGCLELGSDGVPFAPFTAILRDLVRSGGPAADPTGDLGRLLPELGGAAGAADEGRARLFESVLTYLEGRARPDGLILVVEDLHWADASTLDLLVFLLRNLGPAAIHFLVTVRSDGLHRTHPLRRLLPELERLPRVARLDLGPLSRDEVGVQATAVRGTEPDAAALDLLHERSGGNPLFVESFLAGNDPAGAPIPDGLRDLLLSSVEPLPEPTRRVLGLVAAAGVRVRHTLLASAARRAGFTEDALESALRPAVDAQVLRTTEDGYVFRHALLSEALHSDLMPGERVRTHRRYAEALERGVERMPEHERAVQLAHHAYAAHDQPLALTAAWQAAEHAAAVDAYPEHLARIERVLELWDQVPDAAERVGLRRDEVLARASGVCFVAGSLRRAVGYATDGLDELGVTGVHDPRGEPPEHAEDIARLRHARARALKEMGRDGAMEDLGEAALLLPYHHPDTPAVGATLAATFMMRGHRKQATVTARRTLRLSRELGDRRSEADALITLGSLSGPTDYEGGLKQLLEGIGLAREAGHVPAEIRGLTNLGGLLKNLNRLEDSARVSLAGLHRCRVLGLTRTQGGAFTYGLAVTRFTQGRLAESEELLSAIPDGGVTQARALTLRMHLDLYRWRPEAVRATAEEFRRVLPERETSPLEHLPVHMVLQQLALYEGRLVDAGRMALDLLDRVRGDGEAVSMLQGLYRSTRAWFTSIAVLLAEEADAQARQLAEELRQALTELSQVTLHSDWRAADLASQAWLSPVPEESLALFEAALSGLGPDGHVVVRAEYRLAAVRAALRAGDRGRAAEHLASVRHLAARHGMALFEREARVLRARHGLPDPEEPPAAPAAPAHTELTSGPVPPPSADPAQVPLPMGLTRREAEVLTEVAKGLSNRQIGEALFISAKTVSVHVTNLMGKLEVTNRTAAAARGRELGLL